MELDLEIGREYVLTHKRKGVFRAKLLDIVPSHPGDEVDTKFLTFEIPTGSGSGQERLARAKGAATTETNIRPSLVIQIIPSTRSPKLPEVVPLVGVVKPVEPPKESLLLRLQRKLRR